ncbi:hypothetical protein cypCar_00006967 [Cyprinus carpio]|nr:hypothetical protein cypCar_00006967 [Cyprinus carpio]
MACAQRYVNKVVIVTGGTRGIGRGIVKVFVQNGAKVVFCAQETELSAGQSLESVLNKEGLGSCTFVSCDVTKEDDIKRLINVTIERFGQIDCLVNNAGWLILTYLHKGAITAMTKAMAVDESRYQVRVNCISPSNIMTPLWEELAGRTEDAAATVKGGENAQLIGRMGTETESGLAALFLAADATFCTGIDLFLSGGAELNYGFKSQIP